MKNIQNSEKLWDEILKVIARRMSNQILPLIKEVFGIEYPLDVKIIELPTVNTFADGTAVKRPGDITFDMCNKYVDDIVEYRKSVCKISIKILLVATSFFKRNITIAFILFDRFKPFLFSKL